jgi:HEPN domain-containing protein
MSGPDPEAVRRQVEDWLGVAEIDRLAALACLATSPPLTTAAAFHCQQAAEKLLKGFLVHADVSFGKTHDLRKLGLSVASRFQNLAAVVGVMEEWTIWNSAYRYPTDAIPEPVPSPDELRRALAVIDGLAARLRSLAAGKSDA